MKPTYTTKSDPAFDSDYDAILEIQFGTAEKDELLFTVDTTGLFETYLDNLPTEELKRTCKCNCCKQFFSRYGGLVRITDKGKLYPVAFPPTMSIGVYAKAMDAVRKLVVSRPVVGVFSSTEKVWGNRTTKGGWTHFALKRGEKFKVLDSALKLEEKKMLDRGLAEFPISVVQQAHTLLSSGQLYRSEKHEEMAKWLLDLHTVLGSVKNAQHRSNIVWLAAAEAPVGWCHIRSGLLGTLLEDVAAGLDFETIKRRHAEKMDPLKYQRPTALPSEGNVREAEKLVAKLGIAKALERRFATLDDIQTIWRPRSKETPIQTDGVFSSVPRKVHGSPSNVQHSIAPATTMTWVKFMKEVLPKADKIEYKVPLAHRAYSALVTAADPDAPQIFQWDNPVSWYMYNSGSLPNQWNLTVYDYAEVTAVCLQPSMWGDRPCTHQGESAFFILKGCKDTKYKSAGLGLFPEFLKSEYRGVRRTIEAYSQTHHISGYEESNACGLRLQKGGNYDVELRVTMGGVSCLYRLDRWD